MESCDLHKIFGRHTNVGKSLHRIYNASQERNSYQPNVALTLKPSNPLQEHRDMLERHRDALRSKKKAVHIPRKGHNTKPIAKILLQRGRKPKHQIEKEWIANDPINNVRTYVPTKPRGDEIDELQCLMETGSKVRNIMIRPNTQPLQHTKSMQTEIQDRMEELLNEINERQQFLHTMKHLNSKNYAKYENQINREIAVKCHEFKQLDRLLL
eukprot:373745_1